MHVPIAFEQWPEAEMVAIKGGGCGNVIRHDDGVIALRFHLFLSSIFTYNLYVLDLTYVQIVCKEGI
jgi:hypothetical protein